MVVLIVRRDGGLKRPQHCEQLNHHRTIERYAGFGRPAYFSVATNLRMLPRDCPFHEPTLKMMRVVEVNSTNPISRSAIKSGDNQEIQLQTVKVSMIMQT
jgi:hypothetical protein